MGEQQFDDLPPERQKAILEQGRALNDLAFRYALPIIFGPPASIGGNLNHASGILVELGGNHYYLTASHVLEGFEARRLQEPTIRCQVGAVRFDPDLRLGFRDSSLDLVAFTFSREEAESSGTYIYRPSSDWPPTIPKLNDHVIVVGFPFVIREQLGPREYEFNSFSLMTPVTSVADAHFSCVFERDAWVGSQTPRTARDERDFGGISGGPVFAITPLSLALVGIVSEYNPQYDILTVRTLNALRALIPT